MTELINASEITEPIIFDSHAHYDDDRFKDIQKDLFAFLSQHGVGGVITCGCDVRSSVNALRIAQKYNFVYAAAGIHPENLENGTDLDDIEKLCKEDKCVAVGEIGLDYYWNDDNKPLQKQIFSEQLILANRLGMPVIVHDRDAHSDTLEILKEYKPKGVVHSFSGSPEMADEIIKLGMYIGIGGVITFKNARKLPEVVKRIPQERILLETDAPYLTPEPYRSKTNHSAMIYLTAKKIAEIRNSSVDSILRLTFKNAQNLFGI